MGQKLRPANKQNGPLYLASRARYGHFLQNVESRVIFDQEVAIPWQILKKMKK